MQQSAQSGGDIEFPVDDQTYNLLQTLASKLEALDAYRTYLGDASGEDAALYRELAQTDRQHAERLFEALRRRVSGS